MLWGSPIEISKQAQLKNRIKESLLKKSPYPVRLQSDGT